MNAVADWEKWFHSHRSHELAELYIAALRVGLKKGSITAEDLHHVPVKNPSVRGALMKGLKRGGLFEKCAISYGSTKQSHGHSMFRWRLVDSEAALAILDRCAGLVIPQSPKEEKQMEML